MGVFFHLVTCDLRTSNEGRNRNFAKSKYEGGIEMSEIKKALPNYKIVHVGEEEIKIEKLPLGKYAELMFTLKNIPTDIMSDLQNIDTTDQDASIQALFGLFGKAWGQVLEILSIGSGIDKERIENDPSIGLDGGIEMFLAIYEVNNLEKVVSQVKNVINRSTKK